MPEETKDITAITTQYMSLAENAPSVYAYKQGTILTNVPVLARTEYAERMTKSNLTHELVQILRYLYRYTYADRDTIIKQALLFRKEGDFQNVIIEPSWLKKQIEKLVHLGLVERRTFVDEVEYRKTTNSGQDVRYNWSSADKLTCFCLTDRGAGFFKRQTESTGFIEEYLFELNSVEVIRRLTCNSVTTSIAKIFQGLGEIHYCEPTRFGKALKRDMIYGQMITADKREAVIFEPIMQYRDMMIQSPDELAQHFEARAEFLLSAVSHMKAENEGMKITICFIFAEKSEIKLACEIYSRVLEEINELLLTSEPLVRVVNTEMKNAPAPFFVVTKKLLEDGSGSYKLNIRQVFPDFLRRGVLQPKKKKVRRPLGCLTFLVFGSIFVLFFLSFLENRLSPTYNISTVFIPFDMWRFSAACKTRGRSVALG